MGPPASEIPAGTRLSPPLSPSELLWLSKTGHSNLGRLKGDLRPRNYEQQQTRPLPSAAAPGRLQEPMQRGLAGSQLLLLAGRAASPGPQTGGNKDDRDGHIPQDGGDTSCPKGPHRPGREGQGQGSGRQAA